MEKIRTLPCGALGLWEQNSSSSIWQCRGATTLGLLPSLLKRSYFHILIFLTSRMVIHFSCKIWSPNKKHRHKEMPNWNEQHFFLTMEKDEQYAFCPCAKNYLISLVAA